MRHLARSILKVIVMEALLAAILFGSAGRVDLPWVWTLLAVHGAILAVSMPLIDPTLGQERLRPGPGAQDRVTQRVATVLILVHLVIAGLDVGRFHWSPPIPLVVRLIALVVFAAGMGFSMWAMVVNRFFSSVVRLQTDRGHHLIDSGPYRMVRHPGYAGLLVSAVAGGIVIGSLWSLVPLAVAAAVLMRRMEMEDAFLHRELAGYPDYAQRVRYKLLPGLW